MKPKSHRLSRGCAMSQTDVPNQRYVISLWTLLGASFTTPAMKRVSRACFSFLVGWILCFAVAHAATSWDASALKTVSPRADRSFPNGYEVVTEPGLNGQVIKEMPAGDAMVAAYVEVGGQRYYMTDWSYDRYRQGLMYNWIRAKSGSADEMKIVIHQEKPQVIQQETPKASAQTLRESARAVDSAEDLAAAEKRLKYDWEDIEFLEEKRQKMIKVVESPNLDARFRASQEDELVAIEAELEAKVTAYRRARESLAERRQAANGTQETETSERRDYIAEQQQKIRDDAAAYRQQLADERAERDAQNNAAMLQQLTTGLSDLNASMAERSNNRSDSDDSSGLYKKPWIRSEIKPSYEYKPAPSKPKPTTPSYKPRNSPPKYNGLYGPRLPYGSDVSK